MRIGWGMVPMRDSGEVRVSTELFQELKRKPACLVGEFTFVIQVRGLEILGHSVA